MNRALENAVVRLLKRRPFYGQMILNCRREGREGGHPLGVTIRGGAPLLYVNNDPFANLGERAQEALLEHAVRHLLHLHISRRKGRNRHDWDVACDLAVNPGIAGLPADAAHPFPLGLEEGLAAEEYYALLRTPFACGNLDGEGAGDAGRDTGLNAGPGEGEARRGTVAASDDHAVWDEADSTPLALAQEVVRGMAREAWRACNGEVPSELRPLVEGLLAPAPIPWRRVLRQFVATAGRVGRKGSWMREHRRFGHDTPGIRKRRRLNLLVGVDVSESTNLEELREAFARELLQIARGREALITVAYANSRIRRIDSMRGDAVAPPVYLGGGFTDLRPLFAYARSMQPRPAAVIYLTDGKGPAPEAMEFPTLWVLTGEGERPAPWGVELRLDV